MQVIGYGRVSTDEQGHSGLGLAAQRERIEDEAARRRWGPVSWYQDVGSGATLARPQITEALERLDRAGGVLVAARLDRLSRSVRDFAGLLERAAKRDWQLLVLDVAVDTSTPAGSLMAHVLASFANYERALIGLRTREALAQLQAQGVRLGRPVTLDQNTRQRIVHRRAAGHSLRAIAAELNNEGAPTSQGGARWHASTIAAVLRSVTIDR